MALKKPENYAAFTLLLALVLGSPSKGIALGQTPTPEQPVFHYEGVELPKYYVVETFFETLYFCYSSDSTLKTYRRALGSMAIPTRTEAERAMTRAMFGAMAASTYRPDLGAFLADAKGARQIQLSYLRKRVLALREVYWSMLADLRRLGVATTALEDHLEAKVRPTFTMTSIGDPGDDVFEVARLFEIDPPFRIDRERKER